jgi:hypothetical protein
MQFREKCLEYFETLKVRTVTGKDFLHVSISQTYFMAQSLEEDKGLL